MSFVKEPTVAVLNSIQASYADIAVGSGKVTITGLRPFTYDDVTSFIIEKSLVETLNTVRLYITAITAGVEYAYTIVQKVNGVLRTVVISIAVPSTGMTLAQFETAIVAQVQGYIDAGYLKLTVAAIGGPNYGTILTGIAGYPVFLIDGAVQNMTYESLMGNATTASNDGTVFTSNITAFAGTTTVTLTSNAHTIVAGQTLELENYAGTLNGVATGPIQARVKSVTANTIVFDNLVGAGLGIGTMSAKLVPQLSRGAGSDLTSVSSDIVSSNTYTRLAVKEDKNNKRDFGGPTRDELNVYLNEGDADYAVAIARLEEIKNGYAPSTTNSDPALHSV